MKMLGETFLLSEELQNELNQFYLELQRLRYEQEVEAFGIALKAEISGGKNAELARAKLQLLFEDYAQKKDEGVPLKQIHSRTVLMIANEPLIVATLKQFLTYKDQEELWLWGKLGLVNAVDTYDANRGVRFSTYAMQIVHNHAIRCLYYAGKSVNAESLEQMFEFEDGSSEINIASEDLDFRDRFASKDLLAQVYNLLKHLNYEEQYCAIYHFGLYEVKIKSIAELAEDLNRSKTAIANTIKSCRKKFELLTASPKTLNEQQLKQRAKYLSVVYELPLRAENEIDFLKIKELAQPKTGAEEVFCRMRLAGVILNEEQLAQAYISNLKHLTAKEQYCVIMHMGLLGAEHKTQPEIVRELGLTSKVTVSAIIANARKKVRLLLTDPENLSIEEQEERVALEQTKTSLPTLPNGDLNIAELKRKAMRTYKEELHEDRLEELIDMSNANLTYIQVKSLLEQNIVHFTPQEQAFLIYYYGIGDVALQHTQLLTLLNLLPERVGLLKQKMCKAVKLLLADRQGLTGNEIAELNEFLSTTNYLPKTASGDVDYKQVVLQGRRTAIEKLLDERVAEFCRELCISFSVNNCQEIWFNNLEFLTTSQATYVAYYYGLNGRPVATPTKIAKAFRVAPKTVTEVIKKAKEKIIYLKSIEQLQTRPPKDNPLKYILDLDELLRQ